MIKKLSILVLAVILQNVAFAQLEDNEELQNIINFDYHHEGEQKNIDSEIQGCRICETAFSYELGKPPSMQQWLKMPLNLVK